MISKLAHLRHQNVDEPAPGVGEGHGVIAGQVGFGVWQVPKPLLGVCAIRLAAEDVATAEQVATAAPHGVSMQAEQGHMVAQLLMNPDPERLHTYRRL